MNADAGIQSSQRGPATTPFQCSSCGQTFARVDHLARHVRSHSKEKPFVCPKCSKAFGRIDLMKRHVDSKTCETSPVAKRRKIARNKDRVGQACQSCALDHLKCDDQKPCARCVKKNLECVTTAEPARYDDPLNTSSVEVWTGAPSGNVPALENTESPERDMTDFTTSAAAIPEDMAMMPSPQPYSIGALPDNELQLDSAANPPYFTSFAQPAFGLCAQNSVSVTNGVAAYPVGETLLHPAEPDYNAYVDLPPFLHNMFASLPQVHQGFGSGLETPRGLFDFGIESDLQLDTLDFDCLGNYNERVPFDIDQHSHPSVTNEMPRDIPSPSGTGASAQAFHNSIWRFHPQPESLNSTKMSRMVEFSEGDKAEPTVRVDQRTTTDRLDQTSRDKMIAIMFRVWSDDKSTAKPLKVMPSLELLDSLLQFYLTLKEANAASWLHIPSVYPLPHTRPELLLSMVAAGATLLPDLSLRKLGMALQEVVRDYMPICFLDNTRIRDLQTLQANMLQLEIAFWSGNSMRMELAESFQQPILTMLRRRGRLKRSMYKTVAPRDDDDEASLGAKYAAWIEQESWKRLVFRLFHFDTHASMSLLRPPCMSAAELTLPCPEPNAFWSAPSPTAWKMAFTALPGSPHAVPCLPDLLGQSELRFETHAVDVKEASIVVIHGFWRLVSHYQEWNTVFRKPTQNLDGDVGGARYQELTKMLESAKLRLEDSHVLQGNHGLLFELILLHLNISLDDVQHFAGLEGLSEAQRVYPTLQGWLKTPKSRQALWHAGQILRIAETMPQKSIRDLAAVAVYQATLTIWANGVLRRSTEDVRKSSVQIEPPVIPSDVIILNTTEDSRVRRFVALNRGVPALTFGNSSHQVPITDIKRMVECVLHLLRTNHGGTPGEEPPLLENLMQLMTSFASV